MPEEEEKSFDSELVKKYNEFNEGKTNDPSKVGRGDPPLEMIQDKLEKLAKVSSDIDLKALDGKSQPEIRKGIQDLLKDEDISAERKGELENFNQNQIDSKKVASQIDFQLSVLIDNHTEGFTQEQKEELRQAAQQDIEKASKSQFSPEEYDKHEAQKAEKMWEKQIKKCEENVIGLANDADLMGKIPKKQQDAISVATKELQRNYKDDMPQENKKALLAKAIKPMQDALQQIDEKENANLFTKIKNVIETAIEAKLIKRGNIASENKFEEAKSRLTKSKDKELIEKVQGIKEDLDKKMQQVTAADAPPKQEVEKLIQSGGKSQGNAR